jgi:dienelactone hydrolase
MKVKLFNYLFIVCLLFSCTAKESKNDVYRIKQLETAENEKNITAIEDVFSATAILYTTELMPVNDSNGIVSLYEFIFSRNDVENLEYKVESTDTAGQLYFEYGKLITKKIDQEIVSHPFKAVFEKQKNEYKILEISFGEEEQLKKELPKMLEPTGIYNVGEQTFFYNKFQSGNERLLSFQIWYPTNDDSIEKQPFRTDEVVSNLSEFLGLPPFVLSYFSAIESNTISNAQAIPDEKFPVLIYNHGYGGFTQTYQTVFEELVSHGYIVVSVGHENESALLIKENGEVLGNNTDNEFYSKRAPELNGLEIGRWQSTILNSNNIEENDEAYKKMLQLTPLHNESTILWADDTKKVLEKIRTINAEDENLQGIFNIDKIGIFGHSLGGATAGQMCFGLPEIKAGINLDGFQFGDLYENELEVPFMFVSSNQEGNRYLRALTFIENSKQDCYQVVLKEFSHDSFTDLKFITEGDKEVMELQRVLVKSFFDKYLKGLSIDLKELENKFNRISINYSKIKNY